MSGHSLLREEICLWTDKEGRLRAVIEEAKERGYTSDSTLYIEHRDI